jgi:hypothetical protein
MAEKGDENDRKIACFWDDVENISVHPLATWDLSASQSLKAGFKREALVPSRDFAKKYRRNRETECSDICSTPRDGAPRNAGGGLFNAWLPA